MAWEMTLKIFENRLVEKFSLDELKKNLDLSLCTFSTRWVGT